MLISLATYAARTTARDRPGLNSRSTSTQLCQVNNAHYATWREPMLIGYQAYDPATGEGVGPEMRVSAIEAAADIPLTRLLRRRYPATHTEAEAYAGLAKYAR